MIRSPSITPSDTPTVRCPFSVNASIHATSSRSKGTKPPSVAQHPGECRHAPKLRFQLVHAVGHHDQVAGEQRGRTGAPLAAELLLHLVARHEALLQHIVLDQALYQAAYGELAPCHRLTTYHMHGSSTRDGMASPFGCAADAHV